MTEYGSWEQWWKRVKKAGRAHALVSCLSCNGNCIACIPFADEWARTLADSISSGATVRDGDRTETVRALRERLDV